MAAGPLLAPSAAPELDGIPDRAHRDDQYYSQQVDRAVGLVTVTFCVLLFIVMSTRPYGSEYTNNIFAALAKVVLVAIVAYLPGYGSLKLRRELSDICQWVCFITCVAITIFICKSDMGLLGMGFGIYFDYTVCWVAMAWRRVNLPERQVAGSTHENDFATS
ncbi:hypothetical protein C8F01DRAFT_1151103 [Mycena amicta]|nr:hypothetical protein C8F01DRAFT_1151103 [Mycena amicta]